MPNWAGSCWYELRYLDPHNAERLVDPAVEAYWMGPRDGQPAGGVDLYVGGAEHAVLHLLYARFWHKVLYDLGHISSFEPFHKLFNQGMITAYVYRDARGFPVPAAEVEERDGGYVYEGEPVVREYGKMGKSLKNAVTPDEICAEYGADTLRLYEMAMGPLDVSRPWDTRAVVGSYRFLQRLWRNIVDETTGEVIVVDEEPDEDTLRALHKAIDGVRNDMAGLRFNTAIAKVTELNNYVTKLDRGAACGGRTHGAAGGTAGAAHRRGAVAQAGPPRLAGPRGLPRGRPRATSRTRRSPASSRSRARSGHAWRSPRPSPTTTWNGWPWPTTRWSRRWAAPRSAR